MSDLISRQDVYNIIEDHDRKYSLHQEGGVDWYNSLLHDVEMLPSVDMGLSHEIRAILESAPSIPSEHKTTETMIVDGEEMEIDPVSYEVGYSHGQAEHKTGEWEHYIDRNGIPWERCSACGGSTLSVDRENINYCPNCGADMRGEKHE